MLCGFKTTVNGREQGGRLERLLQAGHGAELGRHGEEIRTRTWIPCDRIARDHDDRRQRPLPMRQPHRFQPVHSRHEDIEKQQIEISGLEQCEPLAAIAGGNNAVAGPFQQQPDGRLDSAVIVHDQDFRQRPFPGPTLESKSTAGCKGFAEFAVARKQFAAQTSR
jgi:hypothetical protein